MNHNVNIHNLQDKGGVLANLDKLPKERREWLEVFGNQWAPRTAVRPGTCLKCVYGEGEHAAECVTRNAA